MASIEESNKALAKRFLDALSRGDVEIAAELYGEDFELWTAGSLPFSGTSNREQALAGMPQVLGLFPGGLSFRIDAMTAEGERVAIEARSDGATAKGIRYQQTYHFLMTARDGKIVGFREYMDTELARAVLVEGREPG